MSDTIFKITDLDCRTRNDTLWVPGKWHETSGEGDLGGPGWLHAYDDPLLAILHNPIHGEYKYGILWRGEGEGQRKDDHGLKCGYTRMRVLEQIPAPEITTTQRIAYGILCAKAVVTNAAWTKWADDWLTGKDRTAAAAAAAAALSTLSAWSAWSAWSAARAAAAAAARAPLDLAAIARQAMEVKP